MPRSRMRAPLASLLALATLFAVALPHSVDAQPKPLDSDRSSNNKNRPRDQNESSDSGGSKTKKAPHEACPQCYGDMGKAVVKCKETYDRCQKPCPACRAPGDCERREKCSMPCVKANDACMKAAQKELEACMRGC